MARKWLLVLMSVALALTLPIMQSMAATNAICFDQTAQSVIGVATTGQPIDGEKTAFALTNDVKMSVWTSEVANYIGTTNGGCVNRNDATLTSRSEVRHIVIFDGAAINEESSFGISHHPSSQVLALGIERGQAPIDPTAMFTGEISDKATSTTASMTQPAMVQRSGSERGTAPNFIDETAFATSTPATLC